MKKIVLSALAVLFVFVILALSIGPAVAYTALAADTENERLAIFAGAAVVGMIAHFLKKWFRDEITGDLVKYFFRDYPKRTFAAVATLMGTVVVVFLTNQLTGMDIRPMLMLALTTGYTVDSIANKGMAK